MNRAVDRDRRRLLKGATALGGLALTPWPVRGAFAAPAPLLQGSEFALEIGATPLAIGDRQAVATAVNGMVPAPILRWREGDTVTLKVTNRLPEPSSIHWHGIRLPNAMDGVPGLTFRGIAPGETVRDVEDKLMKVVPDRFLLHAHHWLILHGRYICLARKPRCPDCIINDLCQYKQKTKT